MYELYRQLGFAGDDFISEEQWQQKCSNMNRDDFWCHWGCDHQPEASKVVT